MLATATACTEHGVDVPAPPYMRGTIDLTIGAPEHEGEAYEFGSIRGMGRDAGGRIIVADGRLHNVRVFTPTGQHAFTIGSAGRGPAEFRQPCCVTLDSVGYLWVKDFGNRRYSVFALEDHGARFLRTVLASPMQSGVDERIVWSQEGFVGDVLSLPLPGGRALTIRNWLDSTGTVRAVDTLPLPPADSVDFRYIRRASDERVSAATFHPMFGSVGLLANGSGGMYAAAVSSNYAVAWYDRAGHLINVARRPVVPPELSVRERQQAEALIASIARFAGRPSAEIGFVVPPRKPPIERIGFDLDGNLWVERQTSDGAPREADIFEYNGRWVAVREWPRMIELDFGTATDDSALGVQTDSLGALQIVRLRFR